MSEFGASASPGDDRPPVRELSRPQRRALGVLVEKAFTVPESYPMTLKALTTGANQKSNRSPISNYSEDQMWQTLDELRELGLVGLIETETGRTERFRHYMRKRFTFSEPQLAIITELLLRGKQQMGELRARASRMVKIDSLEDLRVELEGLMEQGYVQATGDLSRRGVDVDHNFYAANEGMTLARRDDDEDVPVVRSAAVAPVATSAVQASTAIHEIEELHAAQAQLQTEVTELREEVSRLHDELNELKRSLGV